MAKYRRRRPAVRRRRVSRRRRPMKVIRQPKADSSIYRKIVAHDVLLTLGGPYANTGSVYVAWGSGGATIGNIGGSQIELFNQPEHIAFKALHKSYQVIGCRIKFIPAHYWGSDNQVREMAGSFTASFSEAPAGTITRLGCLKRPDYREFNFLRGIKKYVGVSKFVRRNNANTARYIPVSTNCTSAGTFLQVQFANFGVGDNLGATEVTWYVKYTNYSSGL